MTAAEEGMLLLCSRLGDPESKPLTMPQFRELGLRVRSSVRQSDGLRQLNSRDLTALGYEPEQADRILQLLDREALLRRYLAQGEQQQIYPLTRLSPLYPRRFLEKQGFSAPPVLFYRGDPALLAQSSLAVIGSRKLMPENEVFARRAGQLAAQAQVVLVSGGAQGADQTAQNACLEAGGSCIVFLPDPLPEHPAGKNTLFLSADGFDLPFSSHRALSRNHLIHMQGDRTLAVQCTYGSGGTWQGCLENLKHGWSDLFVFADGSAGAAALEERGATAIHHLHTLSDLQKTQTTFF